MIAPRDQATRPRSINEAYQLGYLEGLEHVAVLVDQIFNAGKPPTPEGVARLMDGVEQLALNSHKLEIARWFTKFVGKTKALNPQTEPPTTTSGGATTMDSPTTPAGTP